MKHFLTTTLLLLICTLTYIYAGNTKIDSTRYMCDGGMYIHTGYLWGEVEPLGYKMTGAPFGVGGVIRYHFANHWRIGAEGYVSTLHLMKNGSYSKIGWGGVITDFYWRFNRFMPFISLTLGGGTDTNMLMMDDPNDQWEPVGETYYDKRSFFLIDPAIGCDFILTRRIHLSLKVDFLVPFGKNLSTPIGPRFCFGILFYH